MQTRLTLRPGQPGTKRLAQRFGDRLVAVRYRYDAARRRRLKTVELIVDEAPWTPPPSHVMAVRVRPDEPVLRGRVKATGGRWNPEQRVWELPFGAVRALDLEDRIVDGEASTSGYGASRSGRSHPYVDAFSIPPPAV